MKARLGDFLKSVAVSMVIAVAVFALGMYRSFGLWRCVCDGFFVSAVLTLGIGVLKEVRNRGSFDVAEYGLHYIVGITIPALKWDKEDLITYRDRKAQERTSAVSLLAAGAVMLALAFLFFGVYSLTEGAA